jgi:hypothetical protein
MPLSARLLLPTEVKVRTVSTSLVPIQDVVPLPQSRPVSSAPMSSLDSVSCPLFNESQPCRKSNRHKPNAERNPMRILIVLGLVAVAVGCSPTIATRQMTTITHPDGSKETHDTMTLTQSLNETKKPAIQEVLDMK